VRKMRSIKCNGFRTFRFESYNCAHDVYPEHRTEALRWFASGLGSSATLRPKSDFDAFFKEP
jgi:hypothetical protein